MEVAIVNQLEAGLEALRERLDEPVGAVQSGLEALGTKLGVIEPPRRRRRGPWLVVVLVVVGIGLALWWRSRRATQVPEEEVEREELSTRRNSA